MSFNTSTATAVDDEYRENLNNIVVCPDCREFPPNLVEDSAAGDMICASCGVVVGSRIVDTRSEWRTFANDDQNSDDPSRVGEAGNPLFEDTAMGLQTGISREGANAMNLLRVQNKGTDKGTKSLKEGFGQIKVFVEALNAGANVRDTAMHIYKLAEEKKFLRGKPQEAVIAGCIFIACRQNGADRTFREIYQLTRVSKKEIGKVFKLLEKWLLATQEKGETGGATDVSGFTHKSASAPDVLVTRYVSELGIRMQAPIEKLAQDMTKQLQELPALAGRSPLSVAAACIFMACALLGEPRTSKDIAKVAGVSDGTIRTAYKYLYDARNEVVKPEWVADSKGKIDMSRLPTGAN